ncbi:MAG: hypothetical protein D3918_11535 [Candidatus Electrothrix sp. AX2]|nr:hypothetical protein [Candidatus Electrothrix gigas]
MYGGTFKQKYGWYMSQTVCEFGILPEEPDKKKDHIAIYANELRVELANLETREKKEREMLSELILGPPRTDIDEEDMYCENLKHQEVVELHRIEKRQRRIRKKLSHLFENITRDEFGVRKVGEGWVNETILKNIVKKIFPNEKVIHHYREAWLEGLELDVFVSERKIAFEYQGKQHYEPVEVWGGKEALTRQQERDSKKEQLCEENGVILIHVDYTEELNESNIRRRIKEMKHDIL